MECPAPANIGLGALGADAAFMGVAAGPKVARSAATKVHSPALPRCPIEIPPSNSAETIHPDGWGQRRHAVPKRAAPGAVQVIGLISAVQSVPRT